MCTSRSWAVTASANHTRLRSNVSHPRLRAPVSQRVRGCGPPHGRAPGARRRAPPNPARTGRSNAVNRAAVDVGDGQLDARVARLAAGDHPRPLRVFRQAQQAGELGDGRAPAGLTALTGGLHPRLARCSADRSPDVGVDREPTRSRSPPQLGADTSRTRGRPRRCPPALPALSCRAAQAAPPCRSRSSRRGRPW